MIKAGSGVPGNGMYETKQKMNCWEFMGCGREQGGTNIPECGVCPAAIENKLDGVHGGTNAGRACWVVAGTLCLGGTQGTFANKFRICSLCDFYHLVIREEGHQNFLLTYCLLEMLET